MNTDTSAFSRFEYGMKSTLTKEKYVRRLELFFDYFKVEGDNIDQKSERFLKVIKKGKDPQKLTDLIIKYMSYH